MNAEITVKPNKARELAFFFLFTFAITWLIWLTAFFMRNCGWSLPVSSDLLLKLGSFVPTSVGFLSAFVFGGRREAGLLLKSVSKVQMNVKWFLFALLVMPAVSAASCLIVRLRGNRLPELQFPLWFLPIAFLVILMLMGPLGEEVGWRGYALKRMLERHSPFISAALLGTVWSVWHLPLFLINGTTQNTLSQYGLFTAFICYTLYTLSISFLITLVYVRTSGSTFSSILIHTMGNLSLGTVPLIFSKTGAAIFLTVFIIVCIVVLWRFKATMFTLKVQVKIRMDSPKNE